MKPKLKVEIDRLKNILTSNGLDFSLAEGAKAERIAEIEKQLGITFDSDLKDLWQFSNGSGSRSDSWFAVFSDELTPCTFSSLEDAFECWSWFSPYDDDTYEEWSDPEAERDERIQPAYLKHRLWFPFAEFNGFSTSVMFDGDPTDKGKYGQIIVYQHDPDAIYYVAESFLEFFAKSNDLLEANAKELFFL